MVGAYIDKVIQRDVFLAKNNELKGKKKEIQEQIAQLEKNQKPWLEPFEEWIKTAKKP